MSQKQFLSTPSARRATGLGRFLGQDAGNFYPRPPRGGRPATSEILRLRCDFYPRPPRGGRPRDATTIANGMRNFYPRPPRGGRHLDLLDSVPNIDFYPRPPRGGRPRWFSEGDGCESISIHALREEGDSFSLSSNGTVNLFLSTPSARRATDAVSRSSMRVYHFYPRPPRGGRPAYPHPTYPNQGFLSTPSARRATRLLSSVSWKVEFLSTPSARRATLAGLLL